MYQQLWRYGDYYAGSGLIFGYIMARWCIYEQMPWDRGFKGPIANKLKGIFMKMMERTQLEFQLKVKGDNTRLADILTLKQRITSEAGLVGFWTQIKLRKLLLPLGTLAGRLRVTFYLSIQLAVNSDYQ